MYHLIVVHHDTENEDTNRKLASPSTGQFNEMASNQKQQFSVMLLIPGQFPSEKKRGMLFSSTPKEILQKLISIFVKQKPDYLEGLTGVELEHRYKIYALPEIDKTHEKPKIKIPIFSCKEKSGCLDRYCCGKMREMKIDLFSHVMTMNGCLKDKFLRLKKDYSCTWACLNRPSMSVYYIGPDASNPQEGDFLGKIFYPFKCCDQAMQIFTKEKCEGVPDFCITCNCCQIGLICTFPCKSCSIVNFKLLDNSGKQIGNMTKIFSGFFQEAFTFADNYTANFPLYLDWKSKALIIAGILFTDYQMFSKREKAKEESSHHH